MQSESILHASLLDILFEGKNKDYGAYELRKSYNRRIWLAMLGTFIICLLFILLSVLAHSAGTAHWGIPVKEVILSKVDPPEPPTKPLPPLPPKPPVVMVKRIIFTPPLLVKETTDKPVPEMQKLETAVISTIYQDGVDADTYVSPPVEQTTAVGLAPKAVTRDFDKPFAVVEKEARFPGGAIAWKKYLERTLDANVAANEGAPVGNYRVTLEFVVDREGKISQVRATDIPHNCAACAAEAICVIEKGPRWEPAIQNGTTVVFRAVQFITFQVAEQ